MEHSTAGPTSAEALMRSLQTYSEAGTSVLQLRTREPIRAALTLRESLLDTSNTTYNEWDCVNGLRTFTRENIATGWVQSPNPEDFAAALGKPLDLLRDTNSVIHAQREKIHYFAFVDAGPYFENNPYLQELIQLYGAFLPTSNVCIILITGSSSLSQVNPASYSIIELAVPTAPELEVILRRTVTNAEESFPDGSDFEEADYARISLMGLGLTLAEFENHANVSVIRCSDADSNILLAEEMLAGVSAGKTEVVRQSDILELTTTEDIADVGGMDRLKEWVRQRAGCYSDEAREFGIEPPKGMVLVGVPGVGKSLVGKAVASVLGTPLVRLDFGRVFSKYVGDSEGRVREALSMVESMAPICLLVDEIDKGLGGAGGSGDSGTSMRVLGTFLTWLQEVKAPIFVITTANRVSGLPPELLRRGRFDAIFSATMPTESERREVLTIHLRKRDRDIADFSAAEITAFIAKSSGYVPAEIESAVKDGLISAFHEKVDLSMSHILKALDIMVPLSKSAKANIDEIIAWSRDNATPVNYTEQEKSATTGAQPTRRRMIKRN